MTVSYQALRRVNPHSLTEAVGDLSRCATKLGTEYNQYKTNVVNPLRRGTDWHGGGQPSACVVATVNGLAIDTMRRRLAAGAITYVYLAAGMRKARQELTALELELDSEHLEIDDNGHVKPSIFFYRPTDANGGDLASRYQTDLDTILGFASKVDAEAARRLADSDDQPVTTEVATDGVLARAKRDHADAAKDLQQAVDAVDGLIASAARSGIEFKAGDLPDPADLLPPGAVATAVDAGVVLGRLAPPPNKGPHYDTSFDLGTTQRSPKELLAYLREHFNEVFPIQGAPQTLREGERVNLYPVLVPPGGRDGARPQNFPVVASRITKTGWTFNTLPGHVDYPGKVEFDIVKGPDGHVRLDIRGTCGPCGIPGYDWVAQRQWAQLGENLRKVANR